MPTYFGYVERQADDFVNWAEIGKELTGTIEEINNVREAKKTALDEASRAYAKRLTEAPQGEDTNGNKWVIDFTNNASEYMLMQDKLLKSGKLKLKDYLTSRQNLIDGTDNAFGVMKNYQKQYGKVMEDYRAGKVSKATVDNFAFVEKFGDFNKSGLYINPTDGSVNVAMKSEQTQADGKKVYTMSPNPNEFASLNVLNNLMNTNIGKYDVYTKTNEAAKKVGTEVRTFNEGGYTITKKGIMYRGEKLIEDPLKDAASTSRALTGLSKSQLDIITFTGDDKKPLTGHNNEGKVASKYHEIKGIEEGKRTQEQKDFMSKVDTVLAEQIKASKDEVVIKFEQFENDMIATMLPTDYDKQSVLTDNKVFAPNGQQYSYTFDRDEAAADPSKILKVIEKGTIHYELSEPQEGEVREFMRQQLRGKYDQEYAQKTDATSLKYGEDQFPAPGGRRYGGTKYDAKKAGDIEEDISEATFAANLYNGTNVEIQTALDHYKGKDWIFDIKRTEDGVYIQFQDPATQQPIGDEEFFTFWAGEEGKGTDNFVKSVVPKLYGDGFNTDIALRNIQNKSLMPNLELFTPYENQEIEGSEGSDVYTTEAKTEIAALGALGGGVSAKEKPRDVKIERYRKANKQKSPISTSTYNNQ